MIRRRRTEDGEAFGLSLLDMLTCGLGAVALLFVLKDYGQQTALDAKRRASAAATQLLQQTVSSQQIERAAERIQKEANRPNLSNQAASALASLASTRRLLVFLDMSGSMQRYLPDNDSLIGKLSSSGVKVDGKWEQTVTLLSVLLSTPKRLEGFQVLALSDQEFGSKCRFKFQAGYPIVETDKKAWRQPSEIDAVVQSIANTMPCGPANFFETFAAAGAWLGRSDVRTLEPADTVVLITDGLPNRGPVASPCESEADDVNLCVEKPLSGFVSPRSKRLRAQYFLDFFRGLQAAVSPSIRMHVVAMPWPEDKELSVFALELGAIGQGIVLFPGIPSSLVTLGVAQ